ncbi:MAG: helix-turn-helix domain-containing protein [Desulfurococcaceae archaeon]
MGLSHDILELLRRVGEATAKEISKQLNVDINTIKTYMYRMSKAGLVERKKVGTEYVYRLASPPHSPPAPPSSSSSTSTNKVNIPVNMKVNMPVNMKVNIRESLYNVNSNKVNMKVNNKVNIAKSEVNNKYNVNLDSSLYFLFYIKDELKKLIEQIEFYVNSHVNPDVNRHVNPDVNTHVNPQAEEEEGGGPRGVSPPGAGREWAYTIIALINTRKLAQSMLVQSNDMLSITILEKLLTHYIITSNKFVVFNDYRELIEYFNLNVNDIIKSRQSLVKSISKLASYGLVYFIKVNNILKLGLKKKALKSILLDGGINEGRER